jgi:bifunctional DNA-binding transcriptional regulator/antitoxin component of YhaV-PrlF toxin-antitoxin module
MAPKVKRAVRNHIRLSSKNQITIPMSVMREMGVRAGDELEIVPKGREATIRPAARAPWLKHVRALTGVWPAGYLDALRDEWVQPLDSAAAHAAARLRASHPTLRLSNALTLGTASMLGGSVLTTDTRWPRALDVPVRIVAP